MQTVLGMVLGIVIGGLGYAMGHVLWTPEIAHLQTQLHEKEQELRSVRGQVRRVSDDVVKQNAVIADSKKGILEVGAQMAELEKKAKQGDENARASLNALGLRKKKLEGELVKEERRAAELQANLDATEHKLGQASARASKLAADLDKSESKTLAMARSLKKLADREKELKKRNADIRRSLKKFESSFNACSAELDACRAAAATPQTSEGLP